MGVLLNRRDEVRALRLAQSQPSSAGELLGLMDEIKKRTLDTVMSDERVRTRFSAARHRVVAVDYREDKPEPGQPPPRMAEVGIYDYTKNGLVAVVVDLRQGTVLAVEERPGVQPPVAEEELKEACGIAAKYHANNASLGKPKPKVAAFPTPRYQLADNRGRHRCVTLYFLNPSKQETQATVDLSAQEVVPEREINSNPGRTIG